MSALADARAHLRKARQFLESANLSHDYELYDAAASSAVISGINSKDAICLAVTGTTTKSDDHTQAGKELRQSGPVGAALASTFSRLLGLKTPSQYLTSEIAKSQAEKAIEWAQRMYAGAEDVGA
ncbi:MAG: HEPN domain-containing protein [Candidatus Nanopelagicales bacterium]